MNNPAIHSYVDLVKEKERLKILFQYQLQEIKDNISDIKHDLEPVTAVANTIGMLTHKDKSLGLVSTGINWGLDFLLRKVVFKKAGWVTRLVAPFLIRNGLSHFATKKVKEQMPAISKMLKKI